MCSAPARRRPARLPPARRRRVEALPRLSASPGARRPVVLRLRRPPIVVPGSSRAPTACRTGPRRRPSSTTRCARWAAAGGSCRRSRASCSIAGARLDPPDLPILAMMLDGAPIGEVAAACASDPPVCPPPRRDARAPSRRLAAISRIRLTTPASCRIDERRRSRAASAECRASMPDMMFRSPSGAGNSGSCRSMHPAADLAGRGPAARSGSRMQTVSPAEPAGPVSADLPLPNGEDLTSRRRGRTAAGTFPAGAAAAPALRPRPARRCTSRRRRRPRPRRACRPAPAPSSRPSTPTSPAVARITW